MKVIVLPGEKVADGQRRIPYTFVEGDATYAAVIGTQDEDGLYTPLEGRYCPMPGDQVVGVVVRAKTAGYDVDINLPSQAFVSSRSLRMSLPVGSVVIGIIDRVSAVDIDLTSVRRLPVGKLLEFPPTKIPRLIGKRSSMLNLIKEKTAGEIVIGHNGYVWISENTNIPKVLKALSMIDQHAHRSGLTDQVSALLSQ